eukprot:gene20257-24289_t
MDSFLTPKQQRIGDMEPVTTYTQEEEVVDELTRRTTIVITTKLVKPLETRNALFPQSTDPNTIQHKTIAMAAISGKQSAKRKIGPGGVISELTEEELEQKRLKMLEDLEKLTDEQKVVLDRVLEGKNLFFTGGAGTGKSFLLRVIVGRLQALHGRSLHVTASTGIAAFNISGKTLHSFAGVGLGEGEIKENLDKVMTNNHAVKRWRAASVLIIDEISMISLKLFNMIDRIGRVVRATDKPFGGIQVIISGDFAQLPPVFKKDGGSMQYCFQSTTWSTFAANSMVLTKIIRQKDTRFIDLLNRVRFGRATQDDLDTINGVCVRPLCTQDGILPTVLYPRNVDVDKLNKEQLATLDEHKQIYVAVDVGDPVMKGKLDDLTAKGVLELCIGAQVMLLINLSFDDGLVNGSRGVVVGFYKDNLPIVRFQSGIEVEISTHTWSIANDTQSASRCQIPLALAWALSIHKSQGMTIDKLSISLDGVFTNGQTYVALSRAVGLDGLELKQPLEFSHIIAP